MSSIIRNNESPQTFYEFYKIISPANLIFNRGKHLYHLGPCNAFRDFGESRCNRICGMPPNRYPIFTYRNSTAAIVRSLHGSVPGRDHRIGWIVVIRPAPLGFPTQTHHGFVAPAHTILCCGWIEFISVLASIYKNLPWYASALPAIQYNAFVYRNRDGIGHRQRALSSILGFYNYQSRPSTSNIGLKIIVHALRCRDIGGLTRLNWVYICFISGCNDQRTWGGTNIDRDLYNPVVKNHT